MSAPLTDASILLGHLQTFEFKKYNQMFIETVTVEKNYGKYDETSGGVVVCVRTYLK